MKVKISHKLHNHQKDIQHFADNNIDTGIRISGLILEISEKSGELVVCDNGGSMPDCRHIVGELVGKYWKVGRLLPAVSLSINPALTRCIVNDFWFNNTFSGQIEALGSEQDILRPCSTRGRFSNILSAGEAAKRKGVRKTPLRAKEKNCDMCVCTHSGKTNHSQEAHELAYHF
jgi:D-sedoheptulose 7-phosphate isomerase